MSFLCRAQTFKQGSIWLMGSNTGFDFKDDPPKPVSDSRISKLTSRTSTITDELGDLLFYSNGDTVWNKYHEVMLNGTGLGLNPFPNQGYLPDSPSSSCVIVPHPGDGQLYYIFIGDIAGFSYSVVDVSSNAGHGKVIQKKIKLFNGNTSLLTVASHADEKSFWIIAHDSVENFKTYKVSESGIDNQPISKKGPAYDLNFGRSQMKVSPDGTKLVVTNIGNVDFFNFNSMTGDISYLGRSLWTGGIGVEFSPNSEFVYFSTYLQTVVQLDVNFDNLEDIVNSETVVGEYAWLGIVADLQLAYNGKIYGHLELNTPSPETNSLSCIEDPNKKGLDCNYVKNILLLPTNNFYPNLPLSVQSIFRESPAVPEAVGCKELPTQIKVTSLGYADSLQWDFGDGLQKSFLASSGKIIDHVYPQTGEYTLTLKKYIGNISREIVSKVIILEKPVVNIGRDTTLCQGDELLLDAGNNGADFIWSTGEETQQIIVVGENQYQVIVDNGGCTTSDIINVQVFDYPHAELGQNKVICDGEPITLTVPFDASLKYRWSTEATSSEITVLETGEYGVTVSRGRCETKDEVYVQEAQIVFNLSETEFEIPFGTELKLTLNGINIEDYNWNFGDGLSARTVIPVVLHSYLKAGNYEGEIVATNQYGCSSNASFHVVVPEYLFIPNVITPNSDTKNDLFEIQYNGDKKYNLEIYDRWGRTIFSSQSVVNVWSAEGNDSGIYFYQLKLGEQIYKGWLQVIK
ncbi:MAG: PKD domain-containing protein [Chryseolinea sp.]